MKVVVHEQQKEEVVNLTCEVCNCNYSKPKLWEEWTSNIFFKWSMRFCDECRRKKEIEALKSLPDVLNVLAKTPNL